jgi:predicted acylesterase/phospholipase RssA
MVALLLAVSASACSSSLSERVPVPETLAEEVSVSEGDRFRFWGDEVPADLDARISEQRELQLADQQDPSETWNMLALSGGGSNGAFGAGLLVGWTEHGTRPSFRVVTGISIGSIIAPFAFLGPAYDAQLREIFTTLSTDQVLERDVIGGLFGGAALTDVTGLEELIARHATEQVLSEIADESRRGRFLLIGTTNLDAQRPVIWNISRLALSDYPEKLNLFRKIIQASAAIPGVFPPVSIDVEANGARFTELHVDGGVTTQVFAYPPQLTSERIDALLGFNPNRRLYVVRNGKITPEYVVTNAELLPITGRSIDTLIKTQGLGDLYRIYTLARRDGIDYNLAVIPPSFTQVSTEAFDQSYMQALFEIGYEQGRIGYPWNKEPPGVGDG